MTALERNGGHGSRYADSSGNGMSRARDPGAAAAQRATNAAKNNRYPVRRLEDGFKTQRTRLDIRIYDAVGCHGIQFDRLPLHRTLLL